MRAGTLCNLDNLVFVCKPSTQGFVISILMNNTTHWQSPPDTSGKFSKVWQPTELTVSPFENELAWLDKQSVLLLEQKVIIYHKLSNSMRVDKTCKIRQILGIQGWVCCVIYLSDESFNYVQ